MINDRTLALQIKDLLTVCLAKSIDNALTAEIGPHWFDTFSKEDAENSFPILFPDQISLYSCDTQALFKLLRHRENYAHAVLTYFGFLQREAAPDTAARKKQFSHLMSRLITDFRNSMEAHIPVYAIEGSADSALYTYADAITDMLKLADIFRTTADENGVSYYDRMTALVKAHSHRQNIISYPIADVLASLKPGITRAQLINGCAQLNIPVGNVNGTVCLSTADITADLSRLRAFFAEAEAARSKKSKRILLVLLTVAVVVAVIIGITAFFGSQPVAPEDNYYKNSAASVSVTPGKIDLVPLHIYWDNGTPVAECIIINGLDKPAPNVTVDNFSIANDDGIIADQSFGIICDGKTIEPNKTATWTFRFDADHTFIPHADLTDALHLNCNIYTP